MLGLAGWQGQPPGKWISRRVIVVKRGDRGPRMKLEPGVGGMMKEEVVDVGVRVVRKGSGNRSV